MVEITSHSTDRMLGVIVTGRIEPEDYERLEPEMERRAQREESFDVLIEVAEVEGLEPAAIRDALEFTRDYAGKLGRLAVVTTDDRWRRLADLVGKPIAQVLDIDTERFDDRAEAQGWVRVVSLTLALGATVAVSWIAVRGVSVFSGPGPFLDPSWFVIWASQAGLAGVIGMVAGRAWGRETAAGHLVGVVLAAWVGELIVVTLLAPFLAGELSLVHGPAIWLAATGGIIQPLASVTGALLGKASVQHPQAAEPG